MPNQNYSGFLEANNRAYVHLVQSLKTISSCLEPEDALAFVSNAAVFAEMFHTGRFADGDIENIAFEIGRVRPSECSVADPPNARALAVERRLLHVLTRVCGIGGHTRMLNQWICKDRTSLHSVVILDQGATEIPRWLQDSIAAQHGALISCDQSLSRCDKAILIRRFAQDHADLVVLHHSGSDVIPTVAFSVPNCPPVAVLNHADHAFWLGSSVTDIVINLRTSGAEHAAKRRYTSNNTVLPIPLEDTRAGFTRDNARSRFGIPPDQVVLLSVGRSRKYQPCGAHDFVSTANKILSDNSSAHIYVIGETLEGIAPYLRSRPHQRLHFVGPLEDPTIYRCAADIYIESFPFGSNTALLEAALHGLAIVPAYAPLFNLLVAGNDSLQNLLPNPKTEDDYVAQVSELVNSPSKRKRLGTELREKILAAHVGDPWLKQLAAVYKVTDGLSHSPKLMQSSSYESTEADVGLSLWNAMANGMNSYVSQDISSGGAALRHAAYVSKHVGNYRQARRLALRAILEDFRVGSSWRLFLVSLFGKHGRGAGSVVRSAAARLIDKLCLRDSRLMSHVGSRSRE